MTYSGESPRKTERLQNMRALVVDNDRRMRNLVREVLIRIGINEIVDAEDGIEAIKIAEEFWVDLIITEFTMEPIDGLALVKSVRRGRQSRNPKAGIIMLTSNTVRESVLAARDIGITEFLAKPFSYTQLYNRILSVIGNPRPFVEAERYVGPCRRRTFPNGYQGPDRRT